MLHNTHRGKSAVSFECESEETQHQRLGEVNGHFTLDIQ